MKRIISIAIIMLFIALGRSDGFVQARYQWWKTHLNRLQAKKTEILRDTEIDRSVIGMVDNEMERARNILVIYEKSLRNDGTLSHEEKTYTREEIAREVDRLTAPLFSAYYLEFLVNQAGNWNRIPEAKNAVREYLAEVIQKRLGRDGAGLAERIAEEDIEMNEWKSLSMELFTGQMIAGRNEAFEAAKKDVFCDVEKRLSAKNFITNQKQLSDSIIDSAQEYFKDAGFIETAAHRRESLAASWTWKKLEARINRNLHHYAKILSFLGNDRGVSLDRVRYYFQNPSLLEAELFTREFPKHLGPTSQQLKQPFKASENQVLLVIPSDPDCRAILMELDKLRKRAVLSVSGAETDEFFANIRKGADKIIGAGMGRANRIYRGEEKKMHGIMEEESAPEIVNLDEFKDSKKVFDMKLGLVYDYRKKSLDFISWLSDSMKTGSSRTIDEYRYQLARMKEYLDFTADLVSESTDIALIERPQIQNMFTVSVSRLGNIFNFMQFSLSLHERERISLSKDQVNMVREDKGDFSRKLASTRIAVAAYCKEYASRRAERSRAWKNAGNTLRDRIAQVEVDSLLKSSEEQVLLFEKLNYAQEVLLSYATSYGELLNQAGTGKLTPELRKALETHSVLQCLENYDRRKLACELKTRRFLQNESRSAIARLVTLLGFYKRNGIEIRDYPRSEEITALMKRIGKKAEVQVAGWSMNESNYESVDKKGADRLHFIVNRMLWKGSEQSADKDTGFEIVTMDLRGAKVSMSIPHGWEEARGAAHDRGIQRTFSSMDRQSRIELAKIPLQSMTEKEAGEKWLKDSECVKVKERWGRMNGVEYFWTIARDREKNIQETFTFVKNGVALIISGTSKKDRYPLFKKKLQSVIDSIAY